MSDNSILKFYKIYLGLTFSSSLVRSSIDSYHGKKQLNGKIFGYDFSSNNNRYKYIALSVLQSPFVEPYYWAAYYNYYKYGLTKYESSRNISIEI